jgi:hypothetical protein
MKTIPHLFTIAAALVIAGCAGQKTPEHVAGTRSPTAEPTHDGKSLSMLLDELLEVDYAKRADPETPQVEAIRAIGTNAIPWLLKEFRSDPAEFGLKDGQRDQHLTRGSLGFWALGEIGAPAIPRLLKLVEEYPGYAPGALAGIGRPAVSALHQCLANTKMYTTTTGTYAIIPGNTISDMFNATSYGVFSKTDILVFIPAIEAWAEQSTNRQAQLKAVSFLSKIDQLE